MLTATARNERLSERQAAVIRRDRAGEQRSKIACAQAIAQAFRQHAVHHATAAERDAIMAVRRSDDAIQSASPAASVP